MDRTPIQNPTELVRVALVETVQVPPMSKMEINGEAQQPVSGTWVVERVPLKASVVVARAVVHPGGNQRVRMRVINPTPDMVTMYKGTRIATLRLIDDVTAVAAIQQQGSTVGSTNVALREISEQCHGSVSPPE